MISTKLFLQFNLFKLAKNALFWIMVVLICSFMLGFDIWDCLKFDDNKEKLDSARNFLIVHNFIFLIVIILPITFVSIILVSQEKETKNILLINSLNYNRKKFILETLLLTVLLIFVFTIIIFLILLIVSLCINNNSFLIKNIGISCSYLLLYDLVTVILIYILAIFFHVNTLIICSSLFLLMIFVPFLFNKVTSYKKVIQEQNLIALYQKTGDFELPVSINDCYSLTSNFLITNQILNYLIPTNQLLLLTVDGIEQTKEDSNIVLFNYSTTNIQKKDGSLFTNQNDTFKITKWKATLPFYFNFVICGTIGILWFYKNLNIT